jgi:hypothetical protein
MNAVAVAVEAKVDAPPLVNVIIGLPVNEFEVKPQKSILLEPFNCHNIPSVVAALYNAKYPPDPTVLLPFL